MAGRAAVCALALAMLCLAPVTTAAQESPGAEAAPETEAAPAITPAASGAEGEGDSAGAGSYYLDQSGGEIRFVQRLAWTAGEYILRYEVIVERESGGVYEEIVRETTAAPFLDLSLPPGTYRYALRAYDLLDIPGEQSDWLGFEILLALQPELRSFSPEGFFLDEDAQWVLNLNGRNIDPAAEIYLRHGGRSIVPVEKTVASSLGGARLAFNERQLTPGTYEVYVKNPGGLDTRLEGFAIAFRKPLDIYLGAAYAPLFALYGEWNKALGKTVFPLGAELRLGLVPIKRTFGYLGVELTAGWRWFSAPPEGAKMSVHALGAEVNLLYQRWFSNRVMALVFRAGGGVNLLANYHFEYPRGKTEAINILMPQAGGGVSFLWLVKKPFYAEGGINYVHWFSKDDAPPGYLRPWIGGGWQF